MSNITTIIKKPTIDNWLKELSNVITDPYKLLQMLNLDKDTELIEGINARRLFAFRVPYSFVSRMKKGDKNDPLLLQVLTSSQEFINTQGYSNDPLNEQNKDISIIPCILHKYKNRVLFLVKNSCAIHCRYCFRRHYPYNKHSYNKNTWKNALDYIKKHQELDEVIFSGGDPLMAKDHELTWLINMLEKTNI